MNNEKLKSFFSKLNNGYVVAAICLILVAVIAFGLMIGLVARPFITNMTYSTTIKLELDDKTYTSKAKIVLLDDGRYALTVKDGQSSQFRTTFGDYAYGKLVIELDETKQLRKVIWFDDNELNMVVQNNPFKLEFDEQTFTNVGAILLLVFYVLIILVTVVCAILLIVKRNDGKTVFTSKLRLVKRLRELEDMLGVRHE